MESTIAGFAQSFTSHQINTNELCLTDSSGATCYTRSQLNSLLASANQSGSSQTPPPSSDGGAASSSTDSSATPPVLQVNGDNPGIQVGATYTDLGATIERPQADLNLGVTTYVNGIETNPVQIDTSTAATDTIAYVATDSAGLASTSTRTVIVEAVSAPSIAPADNASTTEATSTPQ